jgi:hypothetical protein
LYRAEEATILASQKETDAAGTAARLPSTMHPDVKGPLAKVNGENDAACGSGSSSVIQYVWQNVGWKQPQHAGRRLTSSR